MWIDVQALANECIDIRKYLDSQNLMNLMSNNDKCYDGLIREFYANCSGNKNKSVVRSQVRNVEMELSTKVLRDEFGLIDNGYTVDYKKISTKNVDKLAVEGYNKTEFFGEILQNDNKPSDLMLYVIIFF